MRITERQETSSSCPLSWQSPPVVGMCEIPSFSNSYDRFHRDITNIFGGTIYIFYFLIRLRLYSLKLNSHTDVRNKLHVSGSQKNLASLVLSPPSITNPPAEFGDLDFFWN